LQEKLLQQNEGNKALLETLIKENEPKSMWATKSVVVTKTIKIQTAEPFTRKYMRSKKVMWWALEVEAYFETQMIVTNNNQLRMAQSLLWNHVLTWWCKRTWS
jgi:hypothetical protein